LENLAKQIVRAWVFRTEYRIEMSRLNVELMDKQKVIDGHRSDKKKIEIHYTQKATEHAGYMAPKVTKSTEETSPLKFWVCQSRQAELKTIGSAILSVMEEIPDLFEFRGMLRAIKASIEVLGWPTIAGIKLGLANNLLISGSVSLIRHITQVNSLLSIPEYIFADIRQYDLSTVPAVFLTESIVNSGKLYGLFEEYCKIAQDAAQSQTSVKP
jgi:hypothetical protein